MNKTMIKLITLLIIGSSIGAVGQIFLKNGMKEIKDIDLRPAVIIQSIFKVLTNKLVFWGLFLSVAASFAWLVVLTENNLSFAYPLGVGILFVLVIFLSNIFLKESVNLMGWIGIILILSGVMIIFNSK